MSPSSDISCIKFIGNKKRSRRKKGEVGSTIDKKVEPLVKVNELKNETTVAQTGAVEPVTYEQECKCGIDMVVISKSKVELFY